MSQNWRQWGKCSRPAGKRRWDKRRLCSKINREDWRKAEEEIGWSLGKLSEWGWTSTENISVSKCRLSTGKENAQNMFTFHLIFVSDQFGANNMNSVAAFLFMASTNCSRRCSFRTRAVKVIKVFQKIFTTRLLWTKDFTIIILLQYL